MAIFFPPPSLLPPAHPLSTYCTFFACYELRLHVSRSMHVFAHFTQVPECSCGHVCRVYALILQEKGFPVVERALSKSIIWFVWISNAFFPLINNSNWIHPFSVLKLCASMQAFEFFGLFFFFCTLCCKLELQLHQRSSCDGKKGGLLTPMHF